MLYTFLCQTFLRIVPACKYIKLALKVQDIFMAGNDNNYYLSIVSVKTLSRKSLTDVILNNYANKSFTMSKN